MKRLVKGCCLLWLLNTASAWAINTGPVQVTAVDMSSGGVVDVTIDENLDPDCSGVITFTYAADTIAEIYYTMLMTAKSVGLEVDLGYVEVMMPAPHCELTRVELFK